VTLRETLAVLAEQGRLTPRDVVEEARATPGSALHQHIFGPSDAEAAERWRIDLARNLIRSFRVSYTDADGTRKSVPQYVSLATSDGYAYHATEEVVTDELRDRLLKQGLMREIAALRRKYGAVEGFGEIVRAELLGETA
jgi:hypothetical protein